ncbi:hypothetical protein MesoLjLc_10040 [Mesorhizobium sp. L-8-10]|nr:hypothetical protein MesoLjLc_10040 [Mesorhizobium sp. L-8-10]
MPGHAAGHGVQVRLGAMQLHRPRQWGACWLACQLYEQLELDRFWAARLPDSREGTCWRHILQTLVCYRLIDAGSEWRLPGREPDLAWPRGLHRERYYYYYYYFFFFPPAWAMASCGCSGLSTF